MIVLLIIAYLTVSAGFAFSFVQEDRQMYDTLLELCMGFLMMFAITAFFLPFIVGVVLYRAFDK